jgi:gliding motility-associated-like protein
LGDGFTSNQKNVVHFYKNPGDYKITLIINNDTICPDSISKEVSMFKYDIKKIEVPNVFTPNNDNSNDLFEIKGLEYRCDIYKLWIYNRWGQLIFESLPDVIVWDGKTEGLIVSPGTYIYILQGNGFEISGTVTVSY